MTIRLVWCIFVQHLIFTATLLYLLVVSLTISLRSICWACPSTTPPLPVERLEVPWTLWNTVYTVCVCTCPERTLQRKERWCMILQIQPEEGFCFFSYYWNLLSVGNTARIKSLGVFLPAFLNFIFYCIGTQWPTPKTGKNTSVLVNKGVTTWLNLNLNLCC